MDRLEEDLRFFEQQLETERNPFLRNLILGQIRDIKQQMLNILRQQRLLLQRQNQNLQDALEHAKSIKKK